MSSNLSRTMSQITTERFAVLKGRAFSRAVTTQDEQRLWAAKNNSFRLSARRLSIRFLAMSCGLFLLHQQLAMILRRAIQSIERIGQNELVLPSLFFGHIRRIF